MHPVVHDERTLTDLDHARLTRLVSRQLHAPFFDWLESAEVTNARDVPADLVTMYSRVEVVDIYTHRRQALTICYPEDAEPAAGFISVLSPVGNSLLGLKTADVAKWLTPNGHECSAQIIGIQYQPEAAGGFTR